MQPYAWRVRRGRTHRHRQCPHRRDQRGLRKPVKSYAQRRCGRGALSASAARAQADGLGALAGSWSWRRHDPHDERRQRTPALPCELQCRRRRRFGDAGSALRERQLPRRHPVECRASAATSIFGTWTETSRGVSGQISGTLTAAPIHCADRGPGFRRRAQHRHARAAARASTSASTAAMWQSVSLNLKKN